MYRLILALAITLTATLGSGTAPAQQRQQERNGSSYLQLCSATVKELDGGRLTEVEGIDALHCSAYVSGFVDAVRVTSKRKAADEVCLPEGGVQLSQVVRIFVKYLRDNPQTLHQEARTLLLTALLKAFPCAK